MHLHGTLHYIKCFTFILASNWLAGAYMSAQQPPAGQTQSPPDTSQNPNQAAPPKELPPDSIRPNYVLGPSDQILIRSNAEEINEKPFRIDADGNLNLPLVGTCLPSNNRLGRHSPHRTPARTLIRLHHLKSFRPIRFAQTMCWAPTIRF